MDLRGWELTRIADFIQGLDELSAKTGVHLSCTHPYLDVNGKEMVAELWWSYDEDGRFIGYTLSTS